MTRHDQTHLISIQINEDEIRKYARERISELVKEVDTEFVFWDAKELRRRTCMSWNFIQEQFFLINAFLNTR